ncbi:MAG: hypothetical protein OSA40_10045, partial [Phycisphaerales bacterium]|nr:hypothetical protein [Phycisphaerales bacterium]
ERQHREVGDERSRDVKMAGTFHMPSLSIGICDPRNIWVGTITSRHDRLRHPGGPNGGTNARLFPA